MDYSEFNSRPAKLSLLSSFLVHFVILGQQFSWGIYQPFYLAESLQSSTPFAVAFIGTIAGAIKLCGGVFANWSLGSWRVFGRWQLVVDYRVMILFSAFPIGIGYFLASFVPSSDLSSEWKWALLVLSQSVLPGLGWALAIFPAMALPSKWFQKRRGIAQGIGACGGGIGGFVFCPLTQSMLDSLGIEWCLRITGVISFVLIALASWCARIPPSSSSPLQDQEITLKSPEPAKYVLVKLETNSYSPLRRPLNSPTDSLDFPLFTLGAFIGCFGYIVPTHYAPSYAISILKFTPHQAALSVGMMNMCAAIGRLGWGALSDILGHMNSYVFCYVLDALLSFGLWVSSHELIVKRVDGVIPPASVGMFLVFMALEGIMLGGMITLGPVILADLFADNSEESIVISGPDAENSAVDLESRDPRPKSLLLPSSHPQSLQKSGIATEAPKTDSLLHYMSRLYFLQAIPALLNSPIAGAILTASPAVNGHKNYLYAIIYSAGTLLLGSFCPVWMRIRLGRWKLRIWDGGKRD